MVFALHQRFETINDPPETLHIYDIFHILSNMFIYLMNIPYIFMYIQSVIYNKNVFVCI